MLTLANSVTNAVSANNVHFDDNMLHVALSDGREISVPVDKVDWLSWLAKASPQQRANWSIEPGGFAIYWNDLDDGIEVCHLLSLQPLA